MTLYQTLREDFLFFVLSKTLGFMLMPSNFLIGLGVIGAILLATRWRRLGRRLMAAAAILLAVCAFSPLGYLLLYPLEQRFPPWDPARGAPDGIVILGASIEADLSAAHGVPVVRGAPDRIIRAAMLAHTYPNARIVFSGGSANLISNDAREADFAAAIFEGLGIAKSRLIMERRSRNTLENAEFSRDLVNPKPGERWLADDVGVSHAALGRAVPQSRISGRAFSRGLAGRRPARPCNHSPRSAPRGCRGPIPACANGWGLSPTASPARPISCCRALSRAVASQVQSG